MNVGVIRKEAFLVRMEEISSVIDAGLLRGSTPKDFGTPSVSIKVVR